MKDTKRKILDKALELFNKSGSTNTTVRHIAAALGISHGNLCYHFPGTDDIIINLYEELSDQLSKAVGSAAMALATTEIKLSYIFSGSEQSFAIFYKYRFLLLELVTIMRKIELIKNQYKALQEIRRTQFREIFFLLQNKGYMIEERIPGEFDRVIELMMLTGNFWISESEILFEEQSDKKIKHYSHVFNQLLVPYFTQKGTEEYREYYRL